MAQGLYDFFIERERRRRGTAVPMADDRQRLDPRRFTGLGTAQTPPPGQMPTTVGTTSDAPAQAPTLVPPTPPPPGPPTDLSLTRERLRRLSDPNYEYFEPVRNNDDGKMGRLGDILRQFVISAGEAYGQGQGDPATRLATALGAGIAGGAYGGFHPQVDEERQRLYDIRRLQGREQELIGQQMKDIQVGQAAAEASYTAARPAIERAKIAADMADTVSEEKRALAATYQRMFNGMQSFDPEKNPEHAALAAEAAKQGVILPKKEPGKEYFGSWSPDGRFVVMEKSTGDTEMKFEGQSFAKPEDLNRSDLPDDRFVGLMSDAELSARATSAVAPEIAAIQVDQNTVNDMVNYPGLNNDFPYKNPDGTFNKAKFLTDVALGLAPARYNDLYQSQTRSVANKVAQERVKLMEQQKPIRREVEKFRSSLKGIDAGAANRLVDIFNKAISNKNAKKRAADLAEIYKTIEELR